MRILEIRLVTDGPAPYCEWCGHRKNSGSTHGEIETKNGIPKVRCVVVEYGASMPQRAEGHE